MNIVELRRDTILIKFDGAYITVCSFPRLFGTARGIKVYGSEKRW